MLIRSSQSFIDIVWRIKMEGISRMKEEKNVENLMMEKEWMTESVIKTADGGLRMS